MGLKLPITLQTLSGLTDKYNTVWYPKTNMQFLL